MDNKFYKLVKGKDCYAILVKIDNNNYSLVWGCHKNKTNFNSFWICMDNLDLMGYKLEKIEINNEYYLYD